MRKVILAAAMLSLASSAWAYTPVTDFNNWTPGGPYGSWASQYATLTSGPTSFQVQTPPNSGFGGAWYYIWPPVGDATAETQIQLDVTLNPANSEGIALVVLEDGDGTQFRWAWAGLLPGSYLLTDSISNAVVAVPGGVPGLNLATITFLHIQGDFATTDMAWENLALTPEPSSLVLMGLGALVALRRR